MRNDTTFLLNILCTVLSCNVIRKKTNLQLLVIQLWIEPMKVSAFVLEIFLHKYFVKI